VAHVGDSRLYRLRETSFVQVTEDHSVVAERLRAGLMSEEQARRSRFRNMITRSVGFEKNVKVDTFSLPVLPGDLFLLCSDGLTSMLSDKEIASNLIRTKPGVAIHRLVETANRNGGEDNTTVLLLYYKGNLGRRAIRKDKKWLR
jgi:protein phosphatase